MTVQTPDSALLRYLEAVDEFERRMSIGPIRLGAFLDEALGPSSEIKAGELPAEGVDDFLLLERLHEAGLGELAHRFDVEAVGGTMANEWLEAPDLVVRRKVAADG